MSDGLAEVIEAQMMALDALQTDLAEVTEERNAALKELAEMTAARDELREDLDNLASDESQQLRDAIACLQDLCVDLGYPTRPQLPTGLPNLDKLVRILE